MALVLGYIIQLTFKVVEFEVSSVKHRFIDGDLKLVKVIPRKNHLLFSWNKVMGPTNRVVLYVLIFFY